MLFLHLFLDFRPPLRGCRPPDPRLPLKGFPPPGRLRTNPPPPESHEKQYQILAKSQLRNEGLSKGVFFSIRGFLEFLSSGPDSSKVFQEPLRAAARRAAARGDSWNTFEESGPEWRNSKKPPIEGYTFAYPRLRPRRPPEDPGRPCRGLVDAPGAPSPKQIKNPDQVSATWMGGCTIVPGL